VFSVTEHERVNNLSPNEKIAGVLAPLFALRTENDLGIGDVEGLRQFIDWAASGGFRLVQLLPINETGRDNSPYNAISSVAIEPTTLHLTSGSPADLTQEDFDASVAEVDLQRLRRGNVNYKRVRKLNNALLEKAFVHFHERTRQDEVAAKPFDDFCRAESPWLDDYSLFRALMEKNRGRETWDQWREEHRSLGAARAWLQALGPTRRRKFETRMRFFRYVQWIAHEQWSATKRHAAERGVALMGDVPFGISYYSADVFARPDEFALEWSGGAPPEPYFKDDEFTQKWGQNWGIPLYRWDVMRSKNFDWWRQRVRGVQNFFDIFRIDHVLGFYRLYAFPWRPTRNQEFLPLSLAEMLQRTGGKAPHFAPRDDSTPENREANQRGGEGYLRMVLAEAGATRVVGEDLGTVPKYARPSLRSLGVAGFKIPQWEVHDGRVTPGSEYERLSVATYATHDHKPLRLLWEEAFEKPAPTREQSREELEKIASFATMEVREDPIEFEKDFYPRFMRALFACNSWLALVMITDLLGRKDRFNTPGMAMSANWTWRMRQTVQQLQTNRSVRRKKRLVRQLLKETGRAFAPTTRGDH
jgi:4-alpha-glucanotransferase